MTITITFDQPGLFKASDAADTFLHVRGFAVGSSQGIAHRGILYGDFVIAKWRGMSKKEISELHGIVRGDGRNAQSTSTSSIQRRRRLLLPSSSGYPHEARPDEPAAQ